jgi:hypothetical protein
MDVLQAADDLRRRSLASYPRPLDRLIYLASMRDYNTGLYYHDGLASRYSAEVACQAMADCHREAFRQLVGNSLEELVQQLEAYMASTHTSPADFVTAWKGLEPYRVAIPVESDPLAAQLLFSSFRIALAILESRLHPQPAALSA